MKKKILIVLPWFPYPLNSGGNQAICNGIKALVGDYDVSVLYIDYLPNCHKRLREELKKYLGNVHLYYCWDGRILFSELLRRIVGTNCDYKFRNLLRFRYFSHRVERKIREIISHKDFDCVQMEMFDALSLVDCIPQKIKKIFVHHEIRFMLGQQLLPFVQKKDRFLSLLEKERKQEIDSLNRFDLIITLSKQDKDVLKNNGLRIPCESSFAVVNPVSKNYLENVSSERRLTFVGPEQHLPNKNGVLWFLENCWPTLLNQHYSLDILGCWSEETKTAINEKYQNVCFKGFVDDLGSVLNGSIMIVPVFEGSGIRMKILEAAQLGIPFVTTTVGLSGLNFESEKECFIADNANEFIKCIIEFQDSSKRRLYPKNAHDFFEQNYSMTAFADNRLNILSKLWDFG